LPEEVDRESPDGIQVPGRLLLSSWVPDGFTLVLLFLFFSLPRTAATAVNRFTGEESGCAPALQKYSGVAREPAATDLALGRPTTMQLTREKSERDRTSEHSEMIFDTAARQAYKGCG